MRGRLGRSVELQILDGMPVAISGVLQLGEYRYPLAKASRRPASREGVQTPRVLWKRGAECTGFGHRGRRAMTRAKTEDRARSERSCRLALDRSGR